MNPQIKSTLANAVSYATNFRLWIRGVVASLITGASTSALSALGVSAANVAGVQVDSMTLKQLATVAISGGVVGALAYLQRSPLPKLAPDPEAPPQEKPDNESAP